MSVSGGDREPGCPTRPTSCSLSSRSTAMKRNARLWCPFQKGTYEITRKGRRQCQACRLRKLPESGWRKDGAGGRGHVSPSRLGPRDVCGRMRRRAGVGLRPGASPEGPEGWSVSPFSALGGQVLSGQGRACFSPLLRLCDSFCSLLSCLRQIGGGELGTGSWRPVVCYDPPPSTSCPDPASSRGTVIRELITASDRGVLISPVQLWYNCAPRDSEIKAHAEKAGSFQSVFLSINHRGTRDLGQPFRGQVPWAFGQRAFPADQQSLPSPPCFALHTQVGPGNPWKTLRLPAT